MPQMMPINWMMLMLFFIIIFLLFNTLNYYIFTPEYNKNNIKKSMFKNLNWKW